MLLVKVKTTQYSRKLEVQASFKEKLMSGKMHTMEQRGIFCLSKPPSVAKRPKATSRHEIRREGALGK